MSKESETKIKVSVDTSELEEAVQKLKELQTDPELLKIKMIKLRDKLIDNVLEFDSIDTKEIGAIVSINNSISRMPSVMKSLK